MADTTPWDDRDLATVASTEEVGITSRRPDGSLRPFVTIWAVVAERSVYVRSAYGTDNGWFRRAVRSGTGALRVGRAEHPVTFSPADDAVQDAVDAAYLAEYAGYPSIVRGIVGPSWHAVTLRLDPLG